MSGDFSDIVVDNTLLKKVFALAITNYNLDLSIDSYKIYQLE